MLSLGWLAEALISSIGCMMQYQKVPQRGPFKFRQPWPMLLLLLLTLRCRRSMQSELPSSADQPSRFLTRLLAASWAVTFHLQRCNAVARSWPRGMLATCQRQVPLLCYPHPTAVVPPQHGVMHLRDMPSALCCLL